jgi:hypothetical protein
MAGREVTLPFQRISCVQLPLPVIGREIVLCVEEKWDPTSMLFQTILNA